MKKLFLLLVTIASAFFLQAQTGELLVKNSAEGLYLEHKVAAKEGLYAIGRLYSVHPKFIAAYNKIDVNKGLNIGQLLRIPLSDTNFTQVANTGLPVYYKVGAGEGLMKVSNQNNKVALKSLREWNNLSSDQLKPGTKLVVGFMIPKDGAPIVVNNNIPVRNPEPVKPPEEKPVVNDQPVVSTPPPVTEEIKKQEPENKTVQPGREVVKEDIKPAPSDISNGYFKVYFDQQIKTIPASTNATVTSGIFKTTSGLQDAKYYLLIDGVSPGTIVKVTNPDNNKTIYAKVLGEMSGIRQNQGLDIRISNAAAAALQITEDEKFVVKVNY